MKSCFPSFFPSSCSCYDLKATLCPAGSGETLLAIHLSILFLPFLCLLYLVSQAPVLQPAEGWGRQLKRVRESLGEPGVQALKHLLVQGYFSGAKSFHENHLLLGALTQTLVT